MKTTIQSFIDALEQTTENSTYSREFLLNFLKGMLKEERSDIERAYNAGKSQTSIDCPSSKYYFMNYITND